MYFHHWADEAKRFLVEGHKRPNYFYYATPPDLIKAEDVPEYAGLVYVDENEGIKTIKKAPCLHKEKIEDGELNLGEKFYYNMAHWRSKFKHEKKEREYAQKRLLEEIESKGQGLAYADLEGKYNELKKAHELYVESQAKSESQLHKELRMQNMMARSLAHEVQKYNPKFNFFNWQEENFGKL